MRWGPVIAYALAIFALSSQSEFDFGPRLVWKLVFDFDKVAHAIEYGILAALILRASQRPLWAFVGASLYGLSDEIHQYFVPGRSANPLDLLADMTGAGLVVFTWRQLIRRTTKA